LEVSVTLRPLRSHWIAGRISETQGGFDVVVKETFLIAADGESHKEAANWKIENGMKG
jgi:hypothetical protein